MLNYVVDPSLLASRVPRGTEIDLFAGRTYLSVVGFMFFDVRLRGLAIPWHRDFPEVNLRFYVRRKIGNHWRRGVVFIKEIAPLWAVSAVARRYFHENYVTLRMRHELQLADGSLREGGEATYAWRFARRWNQMNVRTYGLAQLAAAGSIEEFITEHYWGYTKSREGSTIEYEVKHPRWRIWKVADAQLDCDVASLYGSEFVAPLSGPPDSALLAEGSEISMHRGQRFG
jgi:uncharacterized protein YqjF (DUF2071 family)